MILADTSVWIDHLSNLSNPAPEMRQQLARANIVMHPFIVAELALGSLRDRTRTLALLDKMPYRSFSLTEDVEFGVELGLAGYRVAYCDESHVNGEMVTSEHAARSQRQRPSSRRDRFIPLVAHARHFARSCRLP